MKAPSICLMSCKSSISSQEKGHLVQIYWYQWYRCHEANKCLMETDREIPLSRPFTASKSATRIFVAPKMRQFRPPEVGKAIDISLGGNSVSYCRIRITALSYLQQQCEANHVKISKALGSVLLQTVLV